MNFGQRRAGLLRRAPPLPSKKILGRIFRVFPILPSSEDFFGSCDAASLPNSMGHCITIELPQGQLNDESNHLRQKRAMSHARSTVAASSKQLYHFFALPYRHSKATYQALDSSPSHFYSNLKSCRLLSMDTFRLVYVLYFLNQR